MSLAIESVKAEKKEKTALPPQGMERLAKYAERDWERRRSEIVSEMVADIRKRMKVQGDHEH